MIPPICGALRDGWWCITAIEYVDGDMVRITEVARWPYAIITVWAMYLIARLAEGLAPVTTVHHAILWVLLGSRDRSE